METIKEFFKHINYRISSPFIFSFIISWIFWNWLVTIGLIFHDLHGYSDYISLIQGSVTWSSGVCKPVTSALLYTFLNPPISSLIQLFYTWIQKLSEHGQLSILKGGKISVDKYLVLREDAINKAKILEDVIEKESNAIVQLAEKDTEILKLKNEKNDIYKKLTHTEGERENYASQLRTEKSIFKKLSDERAPVDSISQFFPGPWICEFHLYDINAQTVNRDIELFTVEDETYRARGDKRFLIKGATFAKDFQALIFDKLVYTNSQRFSSVSLIKLNEKLWYGVETLTGSAGYSYVRFYPQLTKPKDSLTTFSATEINSPETINAIIAKLKEYAKN